MDPSRAQQIDLTTLRIKRTKGWPIPHGLDYDEIRGGSVRDFRVLEHTADVGFEAFGATREDVFRNAGRALMNVMVDLDSVAARQRIAMTAEAREPASLLVAWLSEIVYLYDAEGWLFRNFELTRLADGGAPVGGGRSSGYSLAAVGIGERFEPGRHQIKLLVKAVTYHQLALEEISPGRWRAQVFLDI